MGKDLIFDMTDNSTKKIIFFDIDGTLIDDTTKQMQESTKEAIRIARENGHICMINTGRTQRLVNPDTIGQITFDGYLMGGGTMVVYHDKVLYHKTLTKELTGRIMDALKKYKIDALLEGREENFSDVPENMYTDSFKRFAAGYAGRHYDTFDHALGRFDKIFAYTDNSAVMKAFRDEFAEELDFIHRENDFYEIGPKGYSKATAIHYITEQLGIPMENTVAIGDSNNDLPMLQCAHTSIAMGNSAKKVLEIADYVTTDANADGIWNALQWLGVLGKL